MIFFPHRIPKCLFLQKSQRNNKKVTDSKCTDISDSIYIIIYISIYCSPWQPEKEKNQSQPQVEKGEMERGRTEKERERRTDGETDRRTDGQTTHGQTDRRTDSFFFRDQRMCMILSCVEISR